MMRRFGCPHRIDSWVAMGTTARLLSNRQRYSPPNAKGTGQVIATETMIETVKTMNAKEGRLLKGVPYCENVEAKRLLSRHCHVKPEQKASRYSLVCTTGPTGVGKTMLLCQNMLQAAHKGCLSVYVDFNGEQPSNIAEDQLGFEARVALRIAWYCSKETMFRHYRSRQLDNHLSDVKKLTIEDAVEKLKKHAKHKGPIFLAVDELKKSAEDLPHDQPQIQLKSNITTLCDVMDKSIQGTKRLKNYKRIYLAVSVYDIVSLAATESGRNLLHQPTPPVFPRWVARGSVDEAAISKLPRAMRIFFDEGSRIALVDKRVQLKKRDKLEEFISTLGALVFASAGHGRRVEALVGELAKLPSSVSALARHVSRPALDLSDWQSDVETVMDEMLDLDNIVTELQKGATETNDPHLFLAHLLEGLFVHEDISDTDEGSRGMHMRLASLDLYGLLGEKNATIGYLPTQVILGLCSKYEKLPKSPRPDYLAKKHDALVGFVKGAATECTKLKKKVCGVNEQPKAFERAMMHAMCAAVLSGRRLADMMRSAQPLPENKEVGSLAHIDVKLEVGSFPCYLEKSKTRTTINAALIKEITAIGSVGNRHRGLAFLPTHKFNLCCDFVLVLPLTGGGRVVLLVLCKPWFRDKLGEDYAFDQFRWGQQFSKEETVSRTKENESDKPILITNAAFDGMDAIRKAEDGPTEIRHVLLTVNEAPREGRLVRMKNTLLSEKWNLPLCYSSAMLHDDEWLMDLDHMRGWCPSVAYSALIGLQVQNLWANANSSDEERRPRR